MKVLTTSALLLGVFLFAGLPLNAQQYQQSYGGGRVTKQSQIGLPGHDPSYVSSGTIGQSARDGGQHKAGLLTGGLPDTPWGAYVRKSGDDIYNGHNGAMRQDNGSLVYSDEIARANYEKRMAAKQRSGAQQQGTLQARSSRYGGAQGNYYQPGSNGGAANYGSGVSSYGSYQK